MCLESTTPLEEWRPVPSFEGIYEVSNLGRVKRVKAGMGARVGRVLHRRSLVKGYVYLYLHDSGKGQQRYVHRLVAEAFLNNPDPTFEVNHIDGVKTHNCAVNLEWVSRSENHRHAFRLGLKSHTGLFVGVKNGRATITPDDANRIRSLKGIVLQKDLACEYGLTQGHISRIQRGVAWAEDSTPS